MRTKKGLLLLLLGPAGMAACGGEITSDGLSDKGRERIEQTYSDHRPVCGATGSRSEGWYWGDTGELIMYANCASMSDPECVAIGSRSEGWSSDDQFIVWDSCHRTVRIAIAGETCGPSIGFVCYDGTYCAGVPEDTLGGTGTCLNMLECFTTTDCFNPENLWYHPACVGYASCDDGQCGWHCGPPNPREGVWSWTTVLLAGVESPHPYPNYLNRRWTVTRENAAKMKLHFSKIDTERGFDFVTITDGGSQMVAKLDGLRTDYWTPEVAGTSIAVLLTSDYSVVKWGFAADAVSFYEQLDPYLCNTDADCLAGEVCEPHQCFNAYAPCYGDCRVQDAPHPGQEGDPCDDSRPCEKGLWCKHVVDGEGTCQGELWCKEGTVPEDCANVFHTEDLGSWACNDNVCTWVPDGQPMERTFVSSDTPLDIPDYNATGVVAELDVDEVFDCSLSVFVSVTIRHTYSGDLIVGLTDPTGHRIVLKNREGGGVDNIVLTERPITTLPVGRANGIWKLDVSDRAKVDIGTLDLFSLHLKCN